MQPGVKISEAYSQVMSKVSNSLKNKIHPILGHSIGFNFKEDGLHIKADNDTVLEPGMTFVLRLIANNIDPKPSR